MSPEAKDRLGLILTLIPVTAGIIWFLVVVALVAMQPANPQFTPLEPVTAREDWREHRYEEYDRDPMNRGR